MAIFNGSGVAIITPFNEDKTVDYAGLEKLIEFQIANGTDSIIICGTTGEASTLSHEEHLECIRFTVEKVAGRIPVIAGTGSNSTETAVYLSVEAEKHGADGLLVVTPYYNKATQKGLYQYFKTVADAVSIPVIMYNVPSRTGCNILPATAVALAKDIENIVAIKEATGDIGQTTTMMAMADGCLDLYSGNDNQIVPLLSIGGLGVISVMANVAPQQTHDMVAKYLDGDVTGSAKMQLDAIPLVDSLFCEVNPIPVKKACALAGLPAGSLRAPLTEIEPANEEKLRSAMEAYGLKLA